MKENQRYNQRNECGGGVLCGCVAKIQKNVVNSGKVCQTRRNTDQITAREPDLSDRRDQHRLSGCQQHRKVASVPEIAVAPFQPQNARRRLPLS